MTQLIEGPDGSSLPSGKMSPSTLLVIGTPLLIVALDLALFADQIVQWEWPALQDWVNIACVHVAATGLWLTGVWIVLSEWAEKSLGTDQSWWRKAIFYLVCAGIYLMSISLTIAGFGAIIYTNVYM